MDKKKSDYQREHNNSSKEAISSVWKLLNNCERTIPLGNFNNKNYFIYFNLPDKSEFINSTEPSFIINDIDGNKVDIQTVDRKATKILKVELVENYTNEIRESVSKTVWFSVCILKIRSSVKERWRPDLDSISRYHKVLWSKTINRNIYMKKSYGPDIIDINSSNYLDIYKDLVNITKHGICALFFYGGKDSSVLIDRINQEDILNLHYGGLDTNPVKFGYQKAFTLTPPIKYIEKVLYDWANNMFDIFKRKINNG